MFYLLSCVFRLFSSTPFSFYIKNVRLLTLIILNYQKVFKLCFLQTEFLGYVCDFRCQPRNLIQGSFSFYSCTKTKLFFRFYLFSKSFQILIYTYLCFLALHNLKKTQVDKADRISEQQSIMTSSVNFFYIKLEKMVVARNLDHQQSNAIKIKKM